MAATAQAYIIFHCSSRELQSRAGFDGWVMLLRDDFDTEDQAWPQEKLRLAGIAKRKMQRLEAGGVEADMLQLVPSCHLLLDPPKTNREEERIWCIEFFRGKMYDSVADDRELVERLNSFQDELLQSARLRGATPRAVQTSPHMQSKRSGSSEEVEAMSARPVPSGEDGGTASLPASPDHREGPTRFAADVGVGGVGERKALSAAALAAALDLSDLDQAQQRYSIGGAFLPILPLGTDDYSVDRGLPTMLPTSTTERWGS